MKALAALLVSLMLSWPMPGATPDSEPDLKAPAWKLVRLHNGVNSVDLNSDGRADVVVVAWRENYNAHGFEATTIYVSGPASPIARGRKETLHIVPVELAETGKGHGGKSELMLRSGGGADGRLQDFRLFIDAKHHAAVLVTANRDFGESFADSQPVTFEYCKLTRNEEGMPGSPTFYFKSYKKEKSKKAYQDVNEAFQAELGIGADGR